MAHSKLEPFSEGQRDIARWAKALGHPARVAILETLARRGACICGEIVDELPLAQATVSQHLKALKEAGLVEGTIEGPRSCYCINAESFNRMAEFLRSWMNDQCCAPGCC